jgi:hypothetical protein
MENETKKNQNIMKKKNLLLSIISIAGIVLAGILLTSKQNSDRDRYEKFLVSEYADFPVGGEADVDGEPSPDRPDLASFTDYIKTLDPELKTVPAWRLQDGLRYSKALQAEQRLKSGSDDIEWTAHPTNMGGRTRVLMFDPNDESNMKVWAGSVTGGLWVNESPFSNGIWRPVNDFWANLSISSLAYDPNNTNTFYAGTGESQTALIIYRESSTRGTGIYRSEDGGETWELLPSTKDWSYVTDILVRDEDGQSVIYAGVVSGIYKGEGHQSLPSDGLYRSTDGGESWTQVLPDIEGESVPYAPSDIETSSDKSRIFVGTVYNLEGKGAACILQSDDGINWSVNTQYQQEILNGKSLPGSSRNYIYPGRIMLSNAPSSPDIMFALVAAGYVRSDLFISYDCVYILKSTDKGGNWSSMNVPMRGGDDTYAYLAWHALDVQVSPINPNLLWIGGLDTWRSFDGGNSWTIQSNWAEMYGNGSPDYVHADIHDFKFRPGSDTDMLIATDGGVFGTTTASGSEPAFFEVNRGYSTLQYYSCAIHPAAGAVHFMGGLQDNGTMFYKRDNTPTFVDMLSGGDGALCFIDKDEPQIHLTTVYHNSIYLYNADKEEDPRGVRSRNLNSGTFVNAMDYNWRDDVLFANGQREEGTYGNTLEVVGVSESNLNNLRKDVPTQSEVPYSCIKWSEHSPQGQSTIYIGTQAGKLFRLQDATRNGTLTDLTGDNFPTANISSIDIGQSEDTLLVTFSNYGVASVWLSVDGGQNWMDKEGDLPDMPVRWAILHPENSNQVMLATELGTWVTNKIMNDQVIWSPKVSGMANVRVDQIKFRDSDNTVLAGTHGRGMFTTTWNVDYTSGVENEVLSGEFNVYPNPTDGIFKITLPYGGKAEVSVSDLSGKIVFQEKFETSPGNVRTINIENYPEGIYLVRIITDGKKLTGKLLKQ